MKAPMRFFSVESHLCSGVRTNCETMQNSLVDLKHLSRSNICKDIGYVYNS
jgi:hypothetical protein